MRRLLLIALLLILPQPSWAQADITFEASTVDTANASEYTFADHDIGPEAVDRCVLVAMHAGSTTLTFTISTVTIGGNAASIVYQQNADNGVAVARLAAVAALLVTSGTTATIVVTPSAETTRMRIATYTLTGTADCTTLADSDFSEAEDPSVSLDVPENGSALGACTDTVGTATWVGLTETYDQADEALMMSSGGAADFATVQTGLTITCNSTTAADSAEIGIFVSFGPAEEEAVAIPARVLGGGVF